MDLYYAPQIAQQQYFLDEDQSRHCIAVMRQKEGDTLLITDGLGARYKAVIVQASPKKCTFSVLPAYTEYEPQLYRIHIGIAPTKNMERLEWFLEKATEIGITDITPLITKHTERRELRPERLQKILVAALKQSQKNWIPRLHPLSHWQVWRKQIQIADYATCAIAYVQEQTRALQDVYKGGDALVLIGPEGDFTPNEVAEAQAAGFIPVSLGKSRLRTETAGIVACHLIVLGN